MNIMNRLLSLAFCLVSFSAGAQFKQIAEGPKFEDPDEGHVKIVQMKNGNTVYFHLTPKDGINLRVYDAAHAEKVATVYNPGFERVKMPKRDGPFWPGANSETIVGIFGLNNDLVVFINESERERGMKVKATLYRIIIDGTTGKVKEEKAMFGIGGFVQLGKNLSAITPSLYSIKKDPYSEHYAIYVAAAEEAGGDQVFHYDAAHKEISHASFGSTNLESYHKVLWFKDMVVIGAERVVVFYFLSDGYDESKGILYTAIAAAGSAPVVYKRLSVPEEYYYRGAIARYNPAGKNIALITIGKQNVKKDDYSAYLNIVDPVSGKAENISKVTAGEQLHEAYKERYDKKKGYEGMPQDMYINNDGSFSVVYEEQEVRYNSSSDGSYRRVDSKVGKMVITTHDKDGKFLSNYIVPKEHWIIFTNLSLFYHADLAGEAQESFRGNQYKSFAYLSGSKGSYIFFNDSERNNEVKKDKFAEIQGVMDCDAFMYKLTGTDIFPKREYLFGEPAKGHMLALFTVSAFDKQTDTYVTIKLNKESARDKMVNLVWLQAQ
jgi:hypothetical protein